MFFRTRIAPWRHDEIAAPPVHHGHEPPGPGFLQEAREKYFVLLDQLAGTPGDDFLIRPSGPFASTGSPNSQSLRVYSTDLRGLFPRGGIVYRYHLSTIAAPARRRPL